MLQYGSKMCCKCCFMLIFNKKLYSLRRLEPSLKSLLFGCRFRMSVLLYKCGLTRCEWLGLTVMSLVCRLHLTPVLMDDSCNLHRTDFTGQKEGNACIIFTIFLILTIMLNVKLCYYFFFSAFSLVLLPETHSICIEVSF